MGTDVGVGFVLLLAGRGRSISGGMIMRYKFAVVYHGEEDGY